MSVFTSFAGGQFQVTIDGVVNPQIDNVPLANANQEYSISLPAGTKQFVLKAREQGDLKIKYTASGSYLTLNYGAFYGEDGISANSVILIIESTIASQVVELVTWT